MAEEQAKRCWGFHRWTRWELKAVSIRIDGKWESGQEQIRQCLRCGLRESREL